MDKRDFSKGLILSLLVPLVPIKAKTKPDIPILYGDGVHDDTKALQAWIDGKPVKWGTGESVNPNLIENRKILIEGTVIVPLGLSDQKIIRHCYFPAPRNPSVTITI